MNRLSLSFLFLAGFGAATPAAEPGAVQRLERLLADAKTVRAEFTQVVLDGDLKPIKESSGTFALSRPGKFRWDYTSPYVQAVVGDGTKVWVYDADLKQVTVKPMDRTLASSPAVLLGGGGSLDDGFAVTDRGEDGGLWWVELAPKVKDTEFERVRLGLGAKFVEVMELHDTLGQTTRITFRGATLNARIPAETFKFVPPAGVDVIGDEGA
jgi:outer membrane lipoprotein carrier protein